MEDYVQDFVMVIYMRRITHQRNSFNIFQRIIGGMEDDEWARRQREWDAWRAEEETERIRQKTTRNIQTWTGRYQEGTLGNDGAVNDKRRI